MSNVSRRNFRTNFFGPKFTASMSIIINQSMIAIHFWSYQCPHDCYFRCRFLYVASNLYNPYPFRG